MRNHEFEEEFLNAAAREAGVSGQAVANFKARVWQRMKAGAEAYGGDDAFWEKGFSKVAAEANEESLDIAGWCLGAAQVLYDDQRDGKVDDEIAHMIRVNLLSAVAQGLQAYCFLDNARALYLNYAKTGKNPPPVKTQPISGT